MPTFFALPPLPTSYRPVERVLSMRPQPSDSAHFARGKIAGKHKRRCVRALLASSIGLQHGWLGATRTPQGSNEVPRYLQAPCRSALLQFRVITGFAILNGLLCPASQENEREIDGGRSSSCACVNRGWESVAPKGGNGICPDSKTATEDGALRMYDEVYKTARNLTAQLHLVNYATPRLSE